MKVIVSNHSQPIYGQVTVPLPIPDEEYDHVIELLEALEIGDFRAWDCHVDEICDCPPVLKRLEGTQINIDELDYLAKRLDSFIPKELAAFQGMVEKMDYTEVFDMINLSFFCDEITVITDFKDTAAIGRNHVLAKNGAMSVEDLEKMDLAGIGRELITSGKGTVTPYGIIYDEGVDILSLYNGEMFPEYHYKASVMDVALVSPYSGCSYTALYLPTAERQIERTLKRFHMTDGDHFGIVAVSTEPPAPDAFRDRPLTVEELYAVNRMAVAMAALDPSQHEKYAAAVDYVHPQTPEQYQKLAESLDMFEFIQGAWDVDDVGRHMILESGHFEVDPNLEDYIDFEAYGRDHMRGGEGKFGEYGYIAYTGDERLAFGPENRRAMGQQMGSMT
ncbi:MAG: antirestriction protein ArdA [Oscillospiraceae bacterium]|nr:antirestriction protein ArdA [Oscillospiraceae bacterium]